MNSLLKRQLRKYVSEEVISNLDLEPFLDAVNRSYNNFDDQFVMLQRAMSISSDELFEANQKLLEETQTQQGVIQKLKKVSDILKLDDAPKNIKNVENPEVVGHKLIEFIDRQTKEIIEMNTQREKLLKSLAHQNEELSEYAHMVSHDLKSPLRSVHTLSTWLSEDYKDKLDDKGNDTIRLIRDNVEKMDVLIDGILEYSTIGKTEIEAYYVDIEVLLEEVVKIIYVPDSVTININAYFPIVKGDKYRLQQLFQNLISNAVNYSDKLEGVVEVGFEDLNDSWKFFVKDNGIGIEEKFFEKIFKTFGKLESNANSSGIGLSIVKKIVNLYNGEIWVESEVGVGSTFYFTLKK